MILTHGLQNESRHLVRYAIATTNKDSCKNYEKKNYTVKFNIDNNFITIRKVLTKTKVFCNSTNYGTRQVLAKGVLCY